MKTTLKAFLAGMAAAFCCSLGNAQIIYSNDFTQGAATNIAFSAPTVANNYAGGTNTAVWLDALGTNDTAGFLGANGVDNTTALTSWVLPFTPQTNNIYLLTAKVGFLGDPGSWIGFGYARFYTNNLAVGFGRFSDTVAGYDWAIMTESVASMQWFTGPGGTPAAGIQTPGITYGPAGPSTNIVQLLLNTKASPWSYVCYINGLQMGPLTSSTVTTNIGAVGISQTTKTTPTNIQIFNFTLTTTLAPFITTQPVVAKTLGSGSAYTNSVTVMADTNGGNLSYQWYANNAALVNGANGVSGANTNTLIINPATTVNQLSNYYVIVSNNFGSATSTLASITVLTNPVIMAPASPSTAITLLTGSAGETGSSPTFSVTAVGAPPLTYEWLTNGIVVAGATNISLSFTNLQAGSPSSFECIVSNSFGTASSTWSATYVAAPTAAYPQLVLGDQPINFWRLNEPDDGNFNEGAVCHDYQSGANGVYTNVNLGQPGYNSSEPTETSMYATPSGLQFSYAGNINSVDLAATRTNGVNAQFSVEAWASCLAANAAAGGAPVISQGVLNASTFFLGVDTNFTKHYQFYVRSAAGTIYKADDTVTMADDVVWHYVVGVCDQAHGTVSLYVDGRLAATTAIPANSGLFETGMPVVIGAGIQPSAANYNVPFTGNIDDVAIYPSVLSSGQIISHYSAVGGKSVPISFVTPFTPGNITYVTGRMLSVPAAIAGTGPLAYYWTNVTTGDVLASGSLANSGTIDATLNIPNAPASLSGDQIELVAANSSGSINEFVSLFSPALPVTLDYTNPILYSNYFNGGTYTIAGLPLTAANFLVGGTNTVWVDELGTNDTGGGLTGSGVPATLQQDSWVVPFTPHAGYVYTINAQVTFYGNPGNWTGPGFAQNVLTNGTDGRFNGGANGYNWMILTESSGNLQYFGGASTANTITNKTPFFTAGVGTHNVQVVLDATGTQWKASGSIDGVNAGSFTYTTKPTIGAAGLTQNTLTANANTNIQWNYFALSQVAPGNVPPYLVSPLPPTNSITLTNSTVSISATAFGTGPFGYYWSNNATVLASGSTNTMAPLPANLSIASSSLSAGPLVLVVTNAFGTNITSITLISPVNPNRGLIQASLSGSQLTLNWPTNLGWTLQAQTNSVSAGIGTNWVIVANSATTNQLIVPVNQTNGSVFYRLVLP